MSNERARKNLSTILQAVASVGQKPLADALGVSESTVSRMKGEEFERLSSLLAACGLKTVPVSMKCYRAEDIDPYIQIARQHLDIIRSADQLVWEED